MTTATTGSLREVRPWPLPHVAALLVALALVWLTWGHIRSGIWVDLDVYEVGGRSIIHGHPLYEQTVHDLPFTYPPFAGVLFVPLALLGASASRFLLTALSVTAYVAAGVLVAGRLGLRLRQAVPVLVLGLSIEPLLRTLLLGQVNSFLLLAVVIDGVVLRRRPGWLGPGWLVGLAAGIKLTPAVFVLYFLLKRDWPSLRRVAAGFTASVAIGFLVAPGASRTYWLDAGFASLSKWGGAALVGSDNQSLYAALLRITTSVTAPPMSSVVLALLGLTCGVLAARRAVAVGDDVAALVSAAFGGLLASPVSWTHHWVWILPGMLVLVARGRWLWTVVLGAVFWVGPMWLLAPLELRELTFGPGKRLVSLAYVLAGLGWLWLIAKPVHRRIDAPTVEVPAPALVAAHPPNG